MIIPIDDTARALLDADSLRGYPDKIDIPDQTYGEIEGRLLRQHPEQDAEDQKMADCSQLPLDPPLPSAGGES